jgi:hypothetical protein
VSEFMWLSLFCVAWVVKILLIFQCIACWDLTQAYIFPVKMTTRWCIYLQHWKNQIIEVIGYMAILPWWFHKENIFWRLFLISHPLLFHRGYLIYS